MAGSARAGSRPRAIRFSKEELASPDVLTNHNHAAPTEDGRIVEKWSFRRSNSFKFVGEECRNVMENVGIQDMSAFAKCFISGPGAEAWLEGLLANKMPKKVGRLALCHMLTPRGGVRAEFTVFKARETGITWSRPAPTSGMITTT